jgi:hypothetical protein
MKQRKQIHYSEVQKVAIWDRWLKRQYPDDKRYHVFHNTIYKSLFIQTRGVLKKELITCL